MQYLKHIYDDPTGGGEDMVVIAPIWADLPSSIRAYTSDDEEPIEFQATREPVPTDEPDLDD